VEIVDIVEVFYILMPSSTVQSKDHTVVDGDIRPYIDEGQRDIETKIRSIYQIGHSDIWVFSIIFIFL
jgi:hypothetical protein